MRIEFYGASEGVTGSMHRITVNGQDILLECGLFQGHRAEANLKNRQMPDWAKNAKALILSHAHIDHSGNIPSLVKAGFEGNIYMTPSTRDLCSVMLRDAAMIQAQDAFYLNKKALKEGRNDKVEPLYDLEDVAKAMSQIISVPRYRSLPIADGVTMTLHDSGHVLGSAVVQLDLAEAGKKRRFVFTGDLGRSELPLLGNPDIVPGADFLLMESTYGDRLHPPFVEMDKRLGEIVKETINRRGRVLIPSFALERAQEVLFALGRLRAEGKIPGVPIYLDSPLTVKITEIYKLHPDCLDPQIRNLIGSPSNDPLAPPDLQYVTEVKDSKELQQSGKPCIIIAGSGMCEAGRILHHLSTGLADKRNSLVMVGYQAENTLGRRLVQGADRVKVFGQEKEVNLQVHQLGGYSSHADQKDLLAYAAAMRAKGKLEHVALVHGEDDQRKALHDKLEAAGIAATVSHKGGQLEI